MKRESFIKKSTPNRKGNTPIDKLVNFFSQAKGFGKSKTMEIRHAERFLEKFNWDVDRTVKYWNEEEDLGHLDIEKEGPGFG